MTFSALSIGGDTKPVIKLHKGSSPWTEYDSPKEITIGSTWETYTIYFTANSSDDVARISFYLGGRIPNGGTLYIDTISFKEVSVVPDAVVASYYYDAFGNITEETGTVNNPIRYAGYQWDSETELYYLNARYYDSKIARFLSEDIYLVSPEKWFFRKSPGV